MSRLELTTCPNCGERKLQKFHRAVTGTRRGKRYSAPAVEFYECAACGERIYDPAAIRQIEQHARSRQGYPPGRIA